MDHSIHCGSRQPGRTIRSAVAELLPVASGLLAGALLVFLRPGLRVPAGVALAVVLGALATFVSGEYLISWSFLLVDVPLVGVSMAVGFAICRASMTRRREGGP
jgi:hypothetical protein